MVVVVGGGVVVPGAVVIVAVVIVVGRTAPSYLQCRQQRNEGCQHETTGLSFVRHHQRHTLWVQESEKEEREKRNDEKTKKMRGEGERRVNFKMGCKGVWQCISSVLLSPTCITPSTHTYSTPRGFSVDALEIGPGLVNKALGPGPGLGSAPGPGLALVLNLRLEVLTSVCSLPICEGCD